MTLKSFESSTIHKELMSNFNKQRIDKTDCDVIFIVGTKRIHAHRFILSGACTYFQTMFSSSFIEGQQKEITLQDVDEDAMELVIGYIYTARINISHAYAENILRVAHMLQLEEVKVWTCEFLKTQLDSSNCIGIAEFAETYSCDQLQSDANSFARVNFLQVMEGEEFLLTSFTHLSVILSHNTFYIPPIAAEEKLYNAIIAWVKYNVPERKQYLAQLLGYVRLSLLGIEFLTDTVKTESIVKEDKKSTTLVEKAKKYVEEVSFRPKEKEGIFMVASNGRSAVVDNLELWPADWRKPSLSKMEENLSIVTDIAYVKRLLYVINAQSHMSAYNPITNQWIKCKSHTLSGRNTRLVGVNGFLFAFGSSTKQCDFRAQRYSAQTKKWRNFSILRKGVTMSEFSVVAVNGLVYIIGGQGMDSYKEHSVIKTIETFNIATKQCTRINTINLNSPLGIGVVVHNEKIYLIGGSIYRRREFGFGVLGKELQDTSSVRYFDTTTNQLNACAKLSSPRANVRLVVHKSKLYAFGGTRNKMPVQTVEVYDEEMDEWRVSDDVIVPWFYNNDCKFAVIPLPTDYTRFEQWNPRIKSCSRVDLSQLRTKPKSTTPDGHSGESLDVSDYDSNANSDNSDSDTFSLDSDTMFNSSDSDLDDDNDLEAMLNFIIANETLENMLGNH